MIRDECAVDDKRSNAQPGGAVSPSPNPAVVPFEKRPRRASTPSQYPDRGPDDDDPGPRAA